jgi:hypothetical protein
MNPPRDLRVRYALRTHLQRQERHRELRTNTAGSRSAPLVSMNLSRALNAAGVTVTVSAPRSVREYARPEQRFIQADLQRLVAPPWPRQFAAYATPEPALLHNQHTQTGPCQHAPRNDPASPPPAITASNVRAAMRHSIGCEIGVNIHGARRHAVWSRTRPGVRSMASWPRTECA